MKVYNGLLYIGGEFTIAGGDSNGGIAAWDGTAWNDFTSFFNGSVHALEVHNNELIIGGSFPGISGSPNIAKFNGTFYGTLGTGGTNGPVTELKSNGTHIYMAGGFTTAGGISANHVARWNATDGWSGVAGGVNEPVEALAFYKSELHAGLGISVGLTEPESPAPTPGKGWVRYTQTGVPWIASQSFDQSVTCFHSATFSVQTAPEYIVSYQWRRNGVPLADGPTGHGSFIQGANTPMLTIQSPTAVDDTTYDCLVFNSCGSAQSFPVSLTTTCCDGDITYDGQVGVPDLLQVINGWGACEMPPGEATCFADIAPPGTDGAVGVPDLLVVINSWGPCP
jgi:hypothetical protein